MKSIERGIVRRKLTLFSAHDTPLPLHSHNQRCKKNSWSIRLDCFGDFSCSSAIVVVLCFECLYNVFHILLGTQKSAALGGI